MIYETKQIYADVSRTYLPLDFIDVPEENFKQWKDNEL